jgi:hypothetical protein
MNHEAKLVCVPAAPGVDVSARVLFDRRILRPRITLLAGDTASLTAAALPAATRSPCPEKPFHNGRPVSVAKKILGAL